MYDPRLLGVIYKDKMDLPREKMELFLRNILKLISH